jgi:hypothetical protein
MMIPLSSTLDSEYMVHVGAWYALFTRFSVAAPLDLLQLP